MNGTTRLKIGEINKNLICVLCGGYFIDATTIIECLHSFCRTCIVTYLKTSKTCPVCDTIVHKTRPHQNIRSDKLLQDLVYKIVPGLYKDEMRRRREFYTCHYEAAPKRPGEERGDEMSDRFAYTEEEKISLALHFCASGANERVDFRRVFATKEDLKARMEKKLKESVDVRYLQCKAAVTIGHLKKFVRLKYGLPSHFQVDMFYNDEPLRNSCTLCDVAYIFNWRRRAPLSLTFCVYESTRKRPWAEETSKVTQFSSYKNQSSSTKAVTPVTTASVPVTDVPTVTTLAEAKSSGVVTVSSSAPLSSVASPPGKLVNSLPIISTSRTEPPKQSNKKQSKPKSESKRTKSTPVKDASTHPLSTGAAAGKQALKAKTSLLGKRPSNTPVPIAPAPAKVATLNTSIMDITKLIRLDTATPTKGPPNSRTPTYVSLLPVGMSQTPKSKPSGVKGSNNKTPSSTITFSVSSILSVVPNKEGSTTVSTNGKPAMFSLINTVPTSKTVLITTSTSATSTPKMLSSSLPAPSSSHSVTATPKTVATMKSTMVPQSRSSELVPTASSSSSLSSSSSSSTVVNTNQSAPASSISSPTPAASASPIPAAVPVQQSQTQGMDGLQTLSTLALKQAESLTRSKSTPEASATKTPTHRPDADKASEITKESVASHVCNKSQGQAAKTSCSSQAIAQTPDNVQPLSNGTANTLETNNTGTPVVEVKSDQSSPPSSDSSISSSSHSSPDINGCSKSPTLSPTSNGSSTACTVRKVTKQKKIADIANTLHKRMSETLLSQVGKRSNSPNGRRPVQSSSPGKKNLAALPQPTELREASAGLLNRHEMAGKQSIQNVPPAKLLLSSGSSGETMTNSQTDEPLNLVKRDKERLVRLANGLFIIDGYPPTVK